MTETPDPPSDATPRGSGTPPLPAIAVAPPTPPVSPPTTPTEAGSAPRPILRLHTMTHAGLVHPKNEDSAAILTVGPDSLLMVLCDGMGGMGRGDLASQLAVREIGVGFANAEGTVAQRLTAAIVHADRVVRSELCNTEEGWPGSTAVVVHVERATARLAWVGDSRGYLIRDHRVIARTRDHKLVQELVDAGQLTPEEAKRSPLGSVITRSLGGRPPTMPAVEPELLPEWKLKIGDRVVLCTDGLSDLVTDAELPKMLANRSVVSVGDQLIAAALSRGGHDNITVVVAACDDPDETAPSEPDPPIMLPNAPRGTDRRGPLTAWVWVALVALGLAIWAAVRRFG
jgi:serine/threonine protein phosphatase PrpC